MILKLGNSYESDYLNNIPGKTRIPDTNNQKDPFPQKEQPCLAEECHRRECERRGVPLSTPIPLLISCPCPKCTIGC